MRKTRAQGFAGWAAVISGLVCALLVSAFAAATARAELPSETSSEWTLRTETDNIQVFTMDLPGSSFKAFKAVAVLDVPIENLMAVMINPRSCIEWVYNCSESYGFGDGSFHDRYAYSVNNMPWPVTDRDYVLHIRTRGDRATGEIVMDLSATPSKRAENGNRIRVNQSDTLYRFIPEGNKTRVVWVQHTNPNGALPGWLVNSLLVDIPVQSLTALEAVARKPRYQGYQLRWDAQGRLIGVEPATTNGG